MRALLDTHILLWWFEAQSRLPRSHKRVIAAASPDNPLHVCDISLWEIATLYELGRIQLAIPLREWLERATAPPLVQICPISPAIASEITSLPSTFHLDPADRIIVSTARVLGASLLTRDDRMIKSKVCDVVS